MSLGEANNPDISVNGIEWMDNEPTEDEKEENDFEEIELYNFSEINDYECTFETGSVLSMTFNIDGNSYTIDITSDEQAVNENNKKSIKIELFSNGISNKIGNKTKYQKEIGDFLKQWDNPLCYFDGEFLVEDENGDIWILTSPNNPLIVSDDDLYNEDEYLSNKDKAVIAFLNNIIDFAGDFKPDLGDVGYEDGFYSAVSKLIQLDNGRVGFKLNANLNASEGIASGKFDFNELGQIITNFEFKENHVVTDRSKKFTIFNKSSLEILSQYDPDMIISIKAFLDSGVVETGYGSGDYEGYSFKLKYTTEWKNGYLEASTDNNITISDIIEVLKKKPLSLIDNTDFDLRLGELHDGYHDIEVNWTDGEPDEMPDDEELYRLIDIEDSNYEWDNVTWIQISYENENIHGFKSSGNISINVDEISNDEIQNSDLEITENEVDNESFRIELSSDGISNKIGKINNLEKEINNFKDKWAYILNLFENELLIEDESGTIWLLATPTNSVMVLVDQFNFFDAKPNKQRAINLLLNTNLINKGNFDCVAYIDYYSGVSQTTDFGDIYKNENFTEQFYFDILNLFKVSNTNKSLKLNSQVRSSQGIANGFFDLTDNGIVARINIAEKTLDQFNIEEANVENNAHEEGFDLTAINEPDNGNLYSNFIQCKFNYRPTFIYLSTCDTIEDAKAQNFEYLGESDANSTGTLEYNITDGDKVIFQYRIPVNHTEEEDLNLDELEGKILVREINVYNSQSIDAFYDPNAEDYEPGSVYYGLAYNFGGVTFNDKDEFEGNELEEYDAEDGEEAEQYFEYYHIVNGKPVLFDLDDDNEED